jgi:hypothetical protein
MIRLRPLPYNRGPGGSRIMKFVHLSFLLATLVLMSSIGCARYEFDVIRPADLGLHVGGKQDAVLPMPPLEYRLRAVEGRLAMAVVNNTGDPITLRGAESFVVDPRGQSHPFRSQTIAPGSYVRMIFPPYERHYHPSGPTIGIGFGTVISSAAPSRHHPSPHLDEGPLYCVMYGDDADERGRYWRWEGESEVRMSLVFDQRGQIFTHELVIRRRKM